MLLVKIDLPSNCLSLAWWWEAAVAARPVLSLAWWWEAAVAARPALSLAWWWEAAAAARPALPLAWWWEAAVAARPAYTVYCYIGVIAPRVCEGLRWGNIFCWYLCSHMLYIKVHYIVSLSWFCVKYKPCCLNHFLSNFSVILFMLFLYCA